LHRVVDKGGVGMFDEHHDPGGRALGYHRPRGREAVGTGDLYIQQHHIWS